MIQDYCLNNHLPPITILIGDENGVPGSGFFAWDILNLEDGKNQVNEYNWELLENPFGYAIEDTTEEDVIESLLKNPGSSEEIYAKVKVRGTAQTIFRKALLKAYKSRCAMCGLSFEFALQAAHIVPWNKASHAQRLDVRNGILLCANHHCLFDSNSLTINQDYQIIANVRVKTKYDILQTTELHTQKVNLPEKEILWPDKNYFAARAALFTDQLKL